MSDPDWDRWVHASIARHFELAVETTAFPMFVETEHRNTSVATGNNVKGKDLFELRIDGPRSTELSSNYWELYTEINVLIQSTMDDDDSHRLLRSVGSVKAAFSIIQIFKFGDGVNDDQTLLGCMKILMDPRRREHLETHMLGQIGDDTELTQAMVEGHYKMCLRT